ncbi:carbamoyltransferase [Sandaracinus amylolyticus]|nr:carbamoyltransferase C-terminal domain-containing protein [Sandaracinus amylolyticus]
MKVLGYNGGLDGYVARFGSSHDSAAALVIDGELVAAAEEERFNRDKHSGAFPIRAMEHCLKEAGLRGFEELDLVCYYHSHDRMWQPGMIRENAPRMSPLGRALLTGAVSGLRAVHRASKLDDARTARTFVERTGWAPPPGKYRVLWHHLAHAASAFYESPFERAVCVALDAQGESHSSTAFVGDARGLHLVDETYAPNSVGYLYQSITYFLGFETGDEYKVMGLAPYGDPARYRRFFERVVRTGAGGRFVIDPEWLGWLVVRDGLMRAGSGYPSSMLRELGMPRRDDEPIEQRHMDLAAALQEALERAVMRWLATLRDRTGEKHLCLAGGVALNCTMNGKIARSGMFDGVHVAPASHDAGTAAGAALYGYHAILGGAPKMPVSERRAKVYLGPSYTTMEARSAVREMRHAVRASRPGDLARAIAEAVADGKVVGFYQGRMEWGPRALGNRSILADPRRADMKDIVNHAVKLREGFRPFAPAVLIEEANDWFDLTGLGGESPYMLFTVPVHEHRRDRIPAVTHVDGSARVQTVRREDNPRFHEILRAFFDITGVPVIMNTSFNVKGEPIVNTPMDAIRCFLGTQIDLLVLDDLILDKRAVVVDRPSRTRDQSVAQTA